MLRDSWHWQSTEISKNGLKSCALTRSWAISFAKALKHSVLHCNALLVLSIYQKPRCGGSGLVVNMVAARPGIRAKGWNQNKDSTAHSEQSKRRAGNRAGVGWGRWSLSLLSGREQCQAIKWHRADWAAVSLLRLIESLNQLLGCGLARG